MDLLISHSVQFKQDRAMYITSLLLANEALCFGMPIFHGLEQLFMDPLSSFLRDVLLIHFHNHSKKFQSFLVIISKTLYIQNFNNHSWRYISSMRFYINAGEWWKADTETVINQATQTGSPPNVSDAYTINGLPGPLYNCSAKGTYFYITGNSM